MKGSGSGSRGPSPLCGFPPDFMFQLTWAETRALRSQSVTLDDRAEKGSGRGKHTKHLAYAFTEQGVAMLSSVLRSEQAIRVNIEIMRAFVRLRQVLASNQVLGRRLDAQEERVRAYCTLAGLELVAILREEGSTSFSSGRSPVS